jgi:hypothetical protein
LTGTTFTNQGAGYNEESENFWGMAKNACVGHFFANWLDFIVKSREHPAGKAIERSSFEKA